ncbi:hypothetical protein OWV82_014091 [Melia azedarach]|uniref:Uncharacterized protein n=1 Tax=Melia azedarach TaxID=155640 RepID=A0ACC1XWX2_MELAZ|nr:hypothetical protein OWV82_014091 [Melia azedarach]
MRIWRLSRSDTWHAPLSPSDGKNFRISGIDGRKDENFPTRDSLNGVAMVWISSLVKRTAGSPLWSENPVASTGAAENRRRDLAEAAVGCSSGRAGGAETSPADLAGVESSEWGKIRCQEILNSPTNVVVCSALSQSSENGRNVLSNVSGGGEIPFGSIAFWILKQSPNLANNQSNCREYHEEGFWVGGRLI